MPWEAQGGAGDTQQHTGMGTVSPAGHTQHIMAAFRGDSVPVGCCGRGLGRPQNPAGLSWGPSCFSHVSGNSTSRKILRFVDKIAKSKYFQKATENEFIKKKMEEVSNTPLLLTVEVQELSGTLAVNILPPPTDRVWYQLSFPPQAHPASSSPCSLLGASSRALGSSWAPASRGCSPDGLPELRLISLSLHPGQHRSGEPELSPPP